MSEAAHSSAADVSSAITAAQQAPARKRKRRPRTAPKAAGEAARPPPPEPVAESSAAPAEAAAPQQAAAASKPAAPQVAAIPQQTAAPSKGKAAASAADSDSDSDSDGGAAGAGGEGGKKKRKRKRTRAAKKDRALPGPSADRNPADDTTLAENVRSSLSYAYQFVHDKEAWKFAKARQLWLVRNALSLPPADAETQVPAQAPVADGNDADEEAPTASWFPDQYLPLVGRYLGTMQGAAKDRFVATLQAAVDAPAVPEPPQSTAEAPPAAAPAPAGASTSFGSIALAAESAGTASAEQAADPVAVEKRRERARTLLRAMGAA
ncbi:hypothetical protein FA09DRAFT_362230 [Tilletiopsis washingtonensis]|uniref:WKF domain-containing protein n=1 Tax=Tilletiopsis washingtonensis TaxID=58919 RepID=A0A316Z3B1_9BASI|nr:hypothetical protein FA09DRAFT_362230 [Tilletiopsis washingtonensis]PWN96287.1 hypothetical protein FA09DRAFT_362230 [Tilletiopsis washingtonensis]